MRARRSGAVVENFYSRPCGRGDAAARWYPRLKKSFLLTPLREGRLLPTSANTAAEVFLLTPLREGRPSEIDFMLYAELDFYSRPCGRGDGIRSSTTSISVLFLLTPLREGRPQADRQELFRFYFYSRPCGRGDM